MKKNILSALAICAALFGCQKNEISEPSFSRVDLHATIEDDASTNTVMDESNNIRWSEGDQIIAFMKSSYGHKYQVKSSFIGETYADFSKVSSSNGDDLSAGMDWDHIVAYYPYAESIKCAKSGNNYALNVVLPSEQTYAAESFGNGFFPMVAVSENNSITFKNVLGGIKLQLKGTQTVKSIKLEGKNNEKLSGAATVTAYTDETKPAITMASGASTSVTLDCGSGVQLNESKATEFIIALPPVLFEKGFNVTVTDAADHKYTMTAGQNNVILRSSILVMSEVVISESGEGFPEEDEEELVIPVLSVTLNPTSLKLYEGDSVQLEVKVKPADATYKSVVWSSSDAMVATVDQTGLVTAVSVGTVEIYAQAGGVVATCSVEVNDKLMTKDYIDEYGINHGKGTLIGTVVWAPVNCGYHATDYQWGKLYQWGRKYGQGYDGDATTPEFSEGGVSLQGGQSANNENVFFIGPDDWLYQRDDQLWNSGTEDSPVKTKYDPCPQGWRVPTYSELEELIPNHSELTINENSQPGYWFSGSSSYSSEVAQVFLPAAGIRDYGGGTAYFRGVGGCYWSSRPLNYGADYLGFYGGRVLNGYYVFSRASGYSVRCVQA